MEKVELPVSEKGENRQESTRAAARLRGGPRAAAAAWLAETAAVSTLLRLLIYLIYSGVMTAFAIFWPPGNRAGRLVSFLLLQIGLHQGQCNIFWRNRGCRFQLCLFSTQAGLIDGE